jgi:cyclophilin family peptidyl-prolyl cis-trans isomerase
MTYQFFSNLTPNTVAVISNLTNQGYYVDYGKYIFRFAPGFVIQGGAPNPDGTGTSPVSPFANENLQQLAFTGTGQLAMANSGGTDSNTSQFFMTLGQQNSDLGYGYPIFGQLLTGVDTVTKISNVPTMPNTGQPAFGDTQPVNPITIASNTLSATDSNGTPVSPNGALVVDTTQAMEGETSTITVTATDSANGTKTTQSFVVTVGAYTGPLDPAINFKPFASPLAPIVPVNTPEPVQLAGTSGYPDTSMPGTLSYTILTQPKHGTVTNFNATTGALTYTPNPGFVGTDTLTYQVTATGPQTTPATTTSNPADVTISVTPPLVTLSNVQLRENGRHQVVQIDVTFSGAVNAAEAIDLSIYQLTAAGKGGSFTGRGHRTIPLKSAKYFANDFEVVLRPRQPFSLQRKVLFQIDGVPPVGLEDVFGRYIDGADNGHPGSDVEMLLRSVEKHSRTAE